MAQMMGGMAGLGLKPRSRYYEFHGRRLYMLKPDRDERLNELEAVQSINTCCFPLSTY